LSFVLVLKVPGLDWTLAETVEAGTRDAGCLVAEVLPRRKWLRPQRPRLFLGDERDGVTVLSDDADRDETAFTFSEGGAELLARTVLVLAEILPAGWSLQACWVDDPVSTERDVSSGELAQLARESALDRETRYRVR